VDIAEGTFVDGSGESPGDLIPPLVIVELVEQIFQGDENLAAIGDALPVAGRSGSLATRFVGSAEIAREHVFAKTGWIDGVYALAGQIDTALDGRLYFVVVARGEVDATAPPAIDELVARIYSCGTNLAAF
jgi:D-alanyl-D-alanine carboxypeptidase/D-alanyl-D-alanine-endopeptidase (penicillin-binding protein 4)